MYKQDYKLTISSDINGEFYWQMFKKGEPIHPTADEKLLMKEMINSVKHGIEVEKFLKTTKEEESKKEDKIWNIDYF